MQRDCAWFSVARRVSDAAGEALGRQLSFGSLGGGGGNPTPSVMGWSAFETLDGMVEIAFRLMWGTLVQEGSRYKQRDLECSVQIPAACSIQKPLIVLQRATTRCTL